MTATTTEPLPSWYDDALHWHTEAFLALLDEVHGPIGAAPWGGAEHLNAMCRYLFEEPDEEAFKAVVGYDQEGALA